MKSGSLKISRSAWSMLVLLSVAAALAVGTSVYLFDRDWTSVRFLAPLSIWQPGVRGWFGALGDTLPSFLHAYAFALLVILALRPWRHASTVGALGWFAIAAMLELLQADVFRDFCSTAAGLLSNLSRVSRSATCLVSGSFDTGDLWASASACCIAWAVSRFAELRR